MRYPCVFFLNPSLRSSPMSLEIFVWAVVGGLIVAILGAGALYYQNESPTNKQLSRDFLIGASFTGFLFPLIPESFDEIKGVITTTAGDIQASLKNTTAISGSLDPGVKIGPANF
jgi:hypothetical protein